MITFIILNGPPSSGKTTISRLLTPMLNNEKARTITDSFAAPMKHFVAVALGERYADMKKDKARPELHGYSVRDFLISLSEDYMKIRYGRDVLSRLLNYRVLRHTPPPDFVICDDGGFIEEAEALSRYYLIRVERDGCTFRNDSRSFLPDPNWTIYNNEDIDQLRIYVRKIAHVILELHSGS